MSKIFHYRRFYNDLDQARRIRRITWHKVATRAGMTTSGLHTFVKQFEDDGVPTKQLSLENTIKLLDWLGKTDIAPYIVDESDASL